MEHTRLATHARWACGVEITFEAREIATRNLPTNAAPRLEPRARFPQIDIELVDAPGSTDVRRAIVRSTVRQ